MQNWQPTNPVERRLMKAHEDWLVFANDRAARLLYWRTDAADLELLKVYFQGQSEMSSAVLELVAPFESPDRYAAALTDEIIAFYDARREGSVQTGIVADWHPPHPGKSEATQYLLTVLESLMTHHPEVFPGMVLVLSPGRADQHRELDRWLDHLLALLSTQFDHLAPRLRFAMYGNDPDALGWLVARRPESVRVIEGRYHMQSLPRELVAQSGERGASGQFRRLFVELSECLSHKDPARLERLRASALSISEGKGWFDQSATVHLLAGAAYLKWGMNDDALNAYREASASGQKALGAAHLAGNKLVLNGLFGEASVHLAKERYRDASRCYEQAANFAHADNASVLLVEAYRMQAWCLDRCREREAALDAGFRALRAGEGLDPAMRANSNLQFAASWMLDRIDWIHARRSALERSLESLYGRDWKLAMQPLSPDEVSTRVIAGEKNDEESAS